MKERTMATYLVLLLSACCLLFGANLVRCGHLVENGNTPDDKTDTTETSSSEKGKLGPGSSAYAREEQEDSASGVSASDATSKLAAEEVINIADIFEGDFGEPLVNIPGLT